MRFGVQLYGIFSRKKDLQPEQIFEKIAAAGARLIEPCISTFRIEGFEQVLWTVERFKEMVPLYTKYGLTAVSCHIISQDLLADKETLRELCEDYGIRQFVVKSPKDLSEKSLQETALYYIQVGECLNSFGAELLLHNEDTDIACRVCGMTAYEYLLDQCLGRVGAQVDVGWAMYGGEDPKALLWRNKYRVKSLHYKDFSQEGGETAIGAGTLDMDACFQFGRAMGIPQICDQDHSDEDIIEDLAAAVKKLGSLSQGRANSVSYLNILDTMTGRVKVLHRFEGVVEAPNWLKKENALLYNSEGLIWHYDIDKDEAVVLESGECTLCNNDHVVSPDETRLGVSHMGSSGKGFFSYVYTLPLSGGEPVKITPNSPSFLHGWSPDGKELAYCAFRQQDTGLEVDIYTIPAEGGEERRITDGGFNDGPEYSPDGRYIWFNSTRSGLMQVWRMHPDGSGRTQMTFNEANNWFPHVSPDNSKVVYIAYRKGDLDPSEHLPNMQVEIWMMNTDGSGKKKLISFFGGQGSINVNSWSSDSRHVAFVSYELLH